MSTRRIVLLIGLLIVGFLEAQQILRARSFSSKQVEISTEATTSASIKEEAVKVKHVIDGDTIELLDGRRVRYIGIDAPEKAHEGNKEECFAQESLAANKQLVEGKSVKLVKDVSEVDSYGRLLRYVYIDGFMVNDRLVEEGFARAWNVPPDETYKQVLFDSYVQAQSQKKGLWQLCGR